MHVLALKTLKQYWAQYPDAEGQLRAWYEDAKRTGWDTPTAIKNRYANASILPNNRVVFDIKGNRYRLVVRINYRSGTVFIRFFGTHDEYNKIDATMI